MERFSAFMALGLFRVMTATLFCTSIKRSLLLLLLLLLVDISLLSRLQQQTG